MGNFRGGSDRNKSNGTGRFGGDRGERREITMHSAVCGECGKNCQVPFKPSNDKPVFCNDCFGAKRGQNEREPRSDRRPDRREERGDRGDRSGERNEYRSTPRGEFSDRRDSRPAPAASTGMSEDIKREFAQMNSKIEALTKLVAENFVKKEVAKVVVEKTEKVESPKADKKEVPTIEKVSAKKTATKKVATKKK